MADQECGCTVQYRETQQQGELPMPGFSITYCPMHKAALEMLKALRMAAAEIQAFPYAGLSAGVCGAVDKALAAARGQEVGA